MERKIGEIFEHNGEWYQCIIGHCNKCSFDKVGTCTFIGNPYCAYRNDKKLVCFKKLEKVGEPYVGNNGTFQSYKLAMPIYGDIPDQIIGFTTTEVVIKQTKEDMEERKLDPRMEKVIDEATQKMGEEIGRQIEANINKQIMKPFNLMAAKAGKPVCTRDGRKARIICFDVVKARRPIVALITLNSTGGEEILQYYPDGRNIKASENQSDLMMLPEKKEGWVNVYKDGLLDTKSYPTKKEAFDKASPKDYVDTIKINWSE